jgi:threonine/homoserine/homoserine lactone efflux protein
MLGDLLPAALGIALSPPPIIAVVVLLGTPRARTTGPSFAFGWILGLLAVVTVASLVFDDAEKQDSTASIAASLLKVACGALFLFLAVKQWRKRPPKRVSGDEPEMPKWLASIETMTAPRVLALGAGLSGANPKNLALTLAAAASVAETGLDGTSTAIVIAAFVMLCSVITVGAVLFHLAAPDRASTHFATIKQFMADHGAVMTTVILLLLGAKLLGDGISGML